MNRIRSLTELHLPGLVVFHPLADGAAVVNTVKAGARRDRAGFPGICLLSSYLVRSGGTCLAAEWLQNFQPVRFSSSAADALLLESFWGPTLT